MPKNYVFTQEKSAIDQPHPRFIRALVIGSLVGVFTGLMAMALAIIIIGLLRLFLSELAFQVAGISITAVIFVIFCALGWVGATCIIWHRSPSTSDN